MVPRWMVGVLVGVSILMSHGHRTQKPGCFQWFSTFRASLPPHTTEKLSTLLPVSDSLCDRGDLIRTNLLVQYCTSTTRHCGVKEVVNTVHATGPDLPRENQVFARLKTRNHNLGTSTVITDRVVHLSL
jgi:hypothetical protein